jgi:outer membrane protein assembly factor BamB
VPPSCDLAWTDLQLGTELDDQIWGMTTDENHNLYAGGFEHGVTGVTNIEPDGNSQGVVIAIAPTGTVQWKAVFDTPATDVVEGVAIEPASGAVYAVGRTSGAFAGFVNRGQFDTFLAALDPRGRTRSIFQSGDERPQHPTRLSLGANHAIAVAGYDDTYIPSNAVEAEEDGFIASFQRGATLEAPFTQRFLQKTPIAAANRLTDVVMDRDSTGSMYVTSQIRGARAAAGIYVTRLNFDGSTAWSTQISGLSADVANAVALSPANELFVTGATLLMLGDKSFGLQDAFVAKVDKVTGKILWLVQAGSADSDYPTALAFDDAGNIYIAGETFGAVVSGQANLGGLDAFAMKLDPSGRLLSAWQAGTTSDDLVTSMVVDRCGKPFVGGYTKGALVQGRQSAGGFDMFVVRPAL